MSKGNVEDWQMDWGGACSAENTAEPGEALNLPIRRNTTKKGRFHFYGLQSFDWDYIQFQ